MCIFEYDEEKHIRCEKEWAYEQGQEAGIELGQSKTLIRHIEAAMKNFGIDLQVACEGLGRSVEEYYKAKERVAITAPD